MFRFSLLRDLTTICSIYLVTIGPLLLFQRLKLHYQPALSRRIAYRYALVFGLLLGICWLVGMAVWIPFAILFVILLKPMAICPLVLPTLLARFHSLLLGFPRLKKSVPRAAVSGDANTPSKPKSLQRLIGQQGVTASALRPAGLVLIDSQRYPAQSVDDRYVDANTSVVVCSVDQGALRVRSQSSAAS